MIFQSAVSMVNCSFSGNEADQGGAVYIFQSGNVTARSCLFNGNRATSGGGAITLADGWLWISGCTFTANSAPLGHSVLCPGGANFEIDSSILWDEANPSDTLMGCTPGITYSNVYGGWPGETNIFAPPYFRDVDGPDNILGNEDDDLRPAAASPGINLGKPDYWVDPNERDLSGHARILCGQIDMGAYEFGIGDVDCDLDIDLARLPGALDDRNEMMSAKADERHAAQTENHLLRVAVVRLSCQLSEAAL